jgi:multidrug transporter EmrE-like cation transporter
MNWIILIIAGLCETGFAFCLGKTKPAAGTEWWAWISGFAFLYVLSAVLLAKATQTIPIGITIPFGRVSALSGRCCWVSLSFTSLPPSGGCFSSAR